MYLLPKPRVHIMNGLLGKVISVGTDVVYYFFCVVYDIYISEMLAFCFIIMQITDKEWAGQGVGCPLYCSSLMALSQVNKPTDVLSVPN